MLKFAIPALAARVVAMGDDGHRAAAAGGARARTVKGTP